MLTDNKWIDLANTIMGMHYFKDGHKNQIAAMLDFAEQYATQSPAPQGEKWYSLEDMEKALNDALNQGHYSFLHPDVFPPVEHTKWVENYIASLPQPPVNK